MRSTTGKIVELAADTAIDFRALSIHPARSAQRSSKLVEPDLHWLTDPSHRLELA